MHKSIIAVLLFCFSCLCFASSDKTDSSIDATLKSNQSGAIKLSEHRGHYLILYFWGDWCGPCKQEINTFKLSSDMPIKLFTVKMGKSHGHDYADHVTVLYDEQLSLSKSLDIEDTPSILLLDQDGRIIGESDSLVAAEQALIAVQ